MTGHPNVLFIVSDQHNAKVLGHVGHPDVRTPNLDRMAAEGVRCDCAITQNPICTPSRVSFLSGQYCHNHGYYGLNGPNPGWLPNVLGHFRGAGYLTAALGKIHCPAYWVEDVCDIFHDTCGTSIGGRSAAYTAFLRERGKEHLEDHGSLPEFGERGRQSMEGRPSPLTFDEAQEGWVANQAIAVMQRAIEEDRPFFVHASFPRPHQCTSPCQEFWDLYDESALTLPPNADYEMVGKAPHLRRTAERWRQGDWTLFEPRTFEAGRLRKLHGYLGAISQVDAAVGRILDFLRHAGLAEDTIVVYTSDHGDYAAEHGIMEKAPGICSDAITRVPQIWWAPGRIRVGHVVTEIVESVDLPATLCALAGLPALETSVGSPSPTCCVANRALCIAWGSPSSPGPRVYERGRIDTFTIRPRCSPIPTQTVSESSTILRMTHGRCTTSTLTLPTRTWCRRCTWSFSTGWLRPPAPRPSWV